MKFARSLVVLVIAASLLAGCSSFKKLTGQRNDTVLPGQREDILPPEQQVNPKPGKDGNTSADVSACDPAVDLNCGSNVDQEAGGAQLQ
jgi:hypothetical protein